MHANKKRSHVFYLLLIWLRATGQPAPPQSTQHGLSVGSQLTSLVDPAGTTGTPFPCTESRRGTLVRAIQANGSVATVDPFSVRAAADHVPYVEFETWVEGLPSDFAESVTGGCVGTRDGSSKLALQRFVRDNFRKVYVRYTMTVETLPRAGDYRVTFADSDAALPADVKGKDDWKVVAPPRYPAPQLVQDGDEIPLDLVTYERGIKLIDYIHAGELDKMPKRADAARDSYAEDAEFTLAQPGLRVNGVARESIVFPETIRGGVLWLYVPGQGRYIVAFAPHRASGFEKAGEVSGNLMTLVADGNVLRIESLDRIAPGGGVYNVYGILDAGWEPADPKDRERFMAGTSPGVETAVGR